MRIGSRSLVPLLLLGLAMLLAGGSTAAADGPGAPQGLQPGQPSDAGAQGAVEAELLKLLRLRMEGRLEQARLLIQMGSMQEALEILRRLEDLHIEGMAEIRQRTRSMALHARSTASGNVEEEEETEEVVEGPVEGGPIGLEGEVAGGAFRSRGGAERFDAFGGRRKKFDDGVEDALRWLAVHQSPNGGWEAGGFVKWCEGKPVVDVAQLPDGQGKAVYDVGVTGLAICAFMGAGYTNRGNHPYAAVVSKGLRYLKNVQDPEGCFGPRSSQQYVYNHATAALAMVEAYGMTGSPIFKSSAQRALDFIAMARNPYFAWRYGIKPGDNDTSVSGWMMMALKSAQLINADAVRRGKPTPLTIDMTAFSGLQAWLDKVTDPDSGRAGYVSRGTGPARPMEMIDRFPAERSESMTAIGVLGRTFLGEDPHKDDLIQKGADLMLKQPPSWNLTDGSIDMYYWYYGTLAMFQVGGKHWRVWQQGMQKAILNTQRQDTDYCQYKGSWDPAGPWGPDGGRVYATALMAMCMQVWYRYERVFDPK
jgi:hypothetical protein